MRYYSTNHKAPEVSFPEALLNGQAPDRGLYMPEVIPQISKELMAAFRGMPYYQIAFEVIKTYLDGQINMDILLESCRDAYNYDVPLERVKDRSYVMRLDQGPTASFKDFAARMMGRLMNHYLQEQNRELLILTATSGDTGSAIANAFLGLDRIKVVILYPENEVTPRQRKQMTTLGRNVRVVSVDGKFDDCQALVKQAFSDPDLTYLKLSSANSINIGRLVPQSVYYFYAWSRLAEDGEKAVFSVPSGNFGDMMGGILAMKMGLPVERFVVAVNDNDEFPKYLHTGIYQKIEPSKNCISSAMNVGHPSNLARLIALYGGEMDEKGIIHQQADLESMRNQIWSCTVSDAETRETIVDTWNQDHVLLEPHGAVGWKGLQSFMNSNPAYSGNAPVCISLETAHPAKFPEEIDRLLGFDPELPDSLKGLDGKPEFVEKMDLNYPAFKEFLTSNY
jgi:threonine synthase